MEKIVFKDASGNEIHGKKYKDLAVTCNFVGNVKDHLDSIKSMECKEDDVFILTYPKSGTHWMFEIVHMLLQGKAEYFKNTINILDFQPMEKLSAARSPRTITGHLKFMYLPQQIEKSKVIYVRRNPKDVAVSMYSMYLKIAIPMLRYNGDWADFLQMFVDGNIPYGSWFEYEMDWQKEIASRPNSDIFDIQYEDMKKDLKGSVKKIAEFLKVKHDDNLISDIARKCDFKEMYEEKNRNVPDEMRKAFSTGKHSMYRKGEIGDWKNWFTVAQNEYFDSVYNENMTASHVQFQFS